MFDSRREKHGAMERIQMNLKRFHIATIDRFRVVLLKAKAASWHDEPNSKTPASTQKHDRCGLRTYTCVFKNSFIGGE
jgi:hypothetical protein